MGKASSGRWSNPIAALAVSRCERPRGLAAWVLAPVIAAGPLALLFEQRPAFLTPVLHAMLLGRSATGPGETFLLPILLIAFLLLTVVGTVPRATLGIARERERRTLEPLLLTRMSPAAILWGELAQVLLVPVVATLALLPLICLSYCMGSISIGSIVAAAGVLLLAHLFFATASLSLPAGAGEAARPSFWATCASCCSPWGPSRSGSWSSTPPGTGAKRRRGRAGSTP